MPDVAGASSTWRHRASRALRTPARTCGYFPSEVGDHSIIWPTGIAHAVEIDDARFDKSAKLEQMMPVTAIARDSRCIEAQHGADLARTQPNDQAIDAGARHHTGPAHLSSIMVPNAGRSISSDLKPRSSSSAGRGATKAVTFADKEDRSHRPARSVDVFLLSQRLNIPEQF